MWKSAHARHTDDVCLSQNHFLLAKKSTPPPGRALEDRPIVYGDRLGPKADVCRNPQIVAHSHLLMEIQGVEGRMKLQKTADFRANRGSSQKTTGI